MRDPHCLQCGVFIRPGKGWKRQTTKRSGGFIHDTCLDMYNNHMKISLVIKKRIRERRRRKAHPELRKYFSEYYTKNKTRINKRNWIYYHTHAEQERERSRKKYKMKHYHREPDNEFLVKIWPKWKTQGGWII